jgi:anti-repressor protein
MNDIQPFTFPDTAQRIRVVQIDSEPWFVAADVCAVLGIADARQAVERLDQDDRCQAPIVDSAGRTNPSTWVVNESGLYDLIIRSDKPDARRFRRWVTSEVLPAIRRTGGYGRPVVDLSAISRRDLASWLVESEDARELAERRTAELEAATAAMAPKVEAFDAFMEADGTYSMGTVANLLGLGRTTLFRRLREEDVLQRDNRPYQRYAQHFKVVGGSHDRNGREVPHYTTYVQPSGVDFIRRRLFPPGSQLALVS